VGTSRPSAVHSLLDGRPAVIALVRATLGATPLMTLFGWEGDHGVPAIVLAGSAARSSARDAAQRWPATLTGTGELEREPLPSCP
jgi:hypothetical protein